ncbi:MAG: PLP-dependent aminotransferase family protein [Cognatishimia sp.]|uniref:MocR-like pyridoxine biosynthesis transcription factor PdxR n=1 Tax=Cognatishimia sp. TaxID=2211648 RepID=UPI003B8BA8C7
MRPVSLSIPIDRESPIPIFEQIAAELRARIMSGAIAAGAQLPPTRAFALQLGVSRSTMVTAYDQLVAEGYISGRRGAGFAVENIGDVSLPSASRAREVVEPVARLLLPFRPGEPDMRLFPHRAWGQAVSRICRRVPEAMLGAAPRFGLPALRHAIAQHVADWRGLEVDPAQIIVTSGASDALELCLRVFCRQGDFAAIEDPGYRPLREFIAAQGLTPEYLAVGAQGAELPLQAKIAVLTPSQHFPLGGSMTPQRRHAFLRWAQQNDGWVIEDDYDSEFRFSGRPIPALASLDGQGRTIYVGSFSKIFSNSLRIGYAVVPPELQQRFADVQRRFGMRASLMPQAPLAEFMQTGEFYRHLRRVRRTYDQRRQFLTDALRRDFSDVGTFDDHQAGMQIAFHLKNGLRDTQVAEQAAKAQVEVESLSAYCAEDRGYNGLLMGFCAFDEEEMAQALTRLRAVFDQL